MASWTEGTTNGALKALAMQATCGPSRIESGGVRLERWGFGVREGGGCGLEHTVEGKEK